VSRIPFVQVKIFYDRADIVDSTGFGRLRRPSQMVNASTVSSGNAYAPGKRVPARRTPRNAHTARMGVLGNLGGGFGEKPVRVSDLEAAARAARESREGTAPAADRPAPAQRESPQR